MSGHRRSPWTRLTSPPDPASAEWAGDGEGLGVFVPGLMGAGILLSGAILVSDGVRKLLPSRGVRRRLNVVRGVRRIVVDMAEAAGMEIEEHNLVGRERRSAWVYAAATFGSLPLAAVVARLGFQRVQLVGVVARGKRDGDLLRPRRCWRARFCRARICHIDCAATEAAEAGALAPVPDHFRMPFGSTRWCRRESPLALPQSR